MLLSDKFIHETQLLISQGLHAKVEIVQISQHTVGGNTYA